MPQNHRPLGRPRTSERRQPTSEIILKEATRLFLDHGFQKVSIDDIAKKCDVTKATVYYYYDSKADLFTETMMAMMQRIRKRILVLLQADKPLYHRLLDVAEAHLKATTALDLDSFMRETKSSLSSEQIKKMMEAEEKMYEALEETFHNGVQQGEIKAINAKFAAHAYLAALKVGNYKQSDGSSLFLSEDEAAEQIVNFFWNGFFRD